MVYQVGTLPDPPSLPFVSPACSPHSSFLSLEPTSRVRTLVLVVIERRLLVSVLPNDWHLEVAVHECY